MNSRNRRDRFESSSFSDLLMQPFRWIGSSLGNLFGDDQTINEDRSLVGMLVALLTLPLRLLWGFLVFMVQSWATSRSAKAFMLGVPAVLVVGLFLSGLWAANFTKETRSVGASQIFFELNKAKSPDKPERAEIFARKLVALKPEVDFFKYQLGESLAASKKNEEAFDIISSLAPADRAGYADAHVWMAMYYLSGEDQQLTEPELRELAVKHLELAREADPNNLKSLILLSRIFEMDANKQEPGTSERQESQNRAIDCLREVVDYRNSNGGRVQETYAAVPGLVRLLNAAGRQDDAKTRLRYELKEMRKLARLNAEYSDVFSIWYTIVLSAVQADEFEQADEAISEGLQLAKTKQDRDKILMLKSMVTVENAKSHSNMRDRKDYGARLKLLCEAIGIYPKNRPIYLELIKFIDTKSNPDFNEAWLRDSVIEAEPGVIHVLLGVHEIDKGNLSQGQKHWRIASQQLSIAQFVVGIIIDVAARENQENFSNLMEMITLALELFPEQATLYQTRGTLLLKEGRYLEAAADFEHVAEKMPRLLVVRQQLVKCYEALEQPEKAAEQELMLNEILGSLEVQERMQAEAQLENDE